MHVPRLVQPQSVGVTNSICVSCVARPSICPNGSARPGRDHEEPATKIQTQNHLSSRVCRNDYPLVHGNEGVVEHVVTHLPPLRDTLLSNAHVRHLGEVIRELPVECRHLRRKEREARV